MNQSEGGGTFFSLKNGRAIALPAPPQDSRSVEFYHMQLI